MINLLAAVWCCSVTHMMLNQEPEGRSGTRTGPAVGNVKRLMIILQHAKPPTFPVFSISSVLTTGRLYLELFPMGITASCQKYTRNTYETGEKSMFVGPTRTRGRSSTYSALETSRQMRSTKVSYSGRETTGTCTAKSAAFELGRQTGGRTAAQSGALGG